MELLINTENKTVKIVGQASLQELIDTMIKMGLGLSEWSVIGTETIWQYYPYYSPFVNPVPCQPWEIICDTNSTNLSVT